MARRRLIEHLLSGVVVVALAAAGVRWMVANKAVGPERPASYAPWTPLGVDTAVYLILDRSCPACNDSAFVAALAVALGRARDREQLRFVGVALGWDPADGFSYLQSLGPFAEVTAGNDWLNSSLLRLVWATTDTRAVTPQAIAIERRMMLDTALDRVVVEGEQRLFQIIGSVQLTAWLTETFSPGEF